MKLKKVLSMILAISMMTALPAIALASRNTPAGNDGAGAVKRLDLNVNSRADAGNTDRVIVKFKKTISRSNALGINSEHSGEDKIYQSDTGTYTVIADAAHSPEEIAAEYAKDSNVEYAEVDYAVQMSSVIPNDPYYSYLQAVNNGSMSIPESWDISQGSSSITVAVLDTGVNGSHPDLSGRILPDGYDFVNGDADPMDDNGHGTMCAGIIAADTDNSTGVAGTDWNCRILPIKVLDAAGSGYVSNIAAGIVYAADQGANVISMSLGGANYSQTLQTAINYAYSRGVVIVAAAGNSNNAIQYPAANDHVIAVGAVNAAGSKSAYSCYGAQLDVVAVGDNVTSTVNNSYATGSGTSFAAPFVAALSALTLSVDPALTPDEVTRLIEESASDLGADGWDQYFGYGRVNFYTTLNRSTADNSPADTTPPVIALNGANPTTVINGSIYSDAGATASDDVDGDITANMTTANPVNTLVNGTYRVTYTAADAAGNTATATRSVIVVSNTKPVITRIGASSVTVPFGAVYSDPGATAADAEDGDLTSAIIKTGTVDTGKAGLYLITYSVSDSMGLAATKVTRKVTVKANVKPVITRHGSSTATVLFGSVYTDLGAAAADYEEGDLTYLIITTSTVNTSRAGIYAVKYNVSDSRGLAATTVSRKVTVKANKKPVITRNGSSRVTVLLGTPYIDSGATAADAEEGDLSGQMIITSTVNTDIPGTYKITYSVKDSWGLAATTVFRTVIVK